MTHPPVPDRFAARVASASPIGFASLSTEPVSTKSDAAAVCFGLRDPVDPLYQRYHDTEWGRPVTDETALFERLCLEVFQSGLSWLTILRRREGFREAFADFDIATVARLDDAAQERLARDDHIIRNRAKIHACVNAARIIEAMHASGQSLSQLIWSHQPVRHQRPDPGHRATQSPESEALALDLRARGFRFVGPVNLYAALQACGLVNDHLAGCPIGDEIDGHHHAA